MLPAVCSNGINEQAEEFSNIVCRERAIRLPIRGQKAMPIPSREQRARLRQDYSGLYETFVWLFADYDPMGLIHMGAPSNEYNLEVDVVLSHLLEAREASDLAKITYKAFADCFGDTFDTPKMRSSVIVKTQFDTLG